MPPGRRQWVFANTATRLPSTQEQLLSMCRAGEAADQELSALMLRFKGDQRVAATTRVWPRTVVDMDVVLDRRLGALHELFKTMLGIYRGKGPQGDLWEQLLLATFPAGAVYYTAQPYIEEAARVESLLNELAKPTWAPLTEGAPVKDAIADVQTAFTPYAEAVRRFVSLDTLAWDAVKRLDRQNHDRLCQLVAGLVWELKGDDAARKEALAPVAQQDQEVYELLRDRRSVLDVDPATGQPIAPTPPGPSPDPGPTA